MDHHIQNNRKKDYMRKLDIRVKRWVRISLPHMSQEDQQKMIDALIHEGENIYDEVSIILNQTEE
jgi:hypothetical protein